MMNIDSMLKIKFFSDFCSSQVCKENTEKIFHVTLKKYYGKDQSIYITTEEDYTHAVILNNAMPKLNISKDKVIGLACEPFEFLYLNPTFVEYAQKHIGKYFIGNKHTLPEPFTEHYSFMWYQPTLQKIFHKKKLMSIVLSDKQSAPGHKYRHQLVKAIQQLQLPVDIYGRGSYMYQGNNVKGEFHGEEPYNDYLFTICIENFQSECYFSEKIIDPSIRQCMPLYLGAKNINQYFPDNLPLNGFLNHDIACIQQVLSNPAKFYRESNVDTILANIDLIDFLLQHFS